MKNLNGPEETRSKIIEATKEINKSVTKMYSFIEMRHMRHFHASTTSLCSVIHLINVSHSQAVYLGYTLGLDDNLVEVCEYKKALNTFISIYLSVFFPKISLQKGTVYPRSTFIGDLVSQMWLDKETNLGSIPLQNTLHNSYKNFVFSTAGFVYGDSSEEYSRFMKPVFETVIGLNIDCINAEEPLLFNTECLNNDYPKIDDEWVRSVCTIMRDSDVYQKVDIPDYIYQHLHTLVPDNVAEIDQFHLHCGFVSTSLLIEKD